MMDPRELYQELILDHGRRPRNFRPMPDASHSAEGKNPLCGDHVIVRLRYKDGVVEDVAFEGSGCAICTAAASTMSEVVKGKTRAAVETLFNEFHDLVTGKGTHDLEDLGKLAAFAGVSEFPMRVKCATLAWHTLQSALDGTTEVTTE
ncbi:MAG TPA: SUF system NifU family Fe-S cluster assembly protein [Polyangiaceae bacterium]|jgi:nitrogen fixation NifU-like protein|nr:SUF system NifU family Fe-S cluster assembly protein [Polyangiaceae bacterium]